MSINEKFRLGINQSRFPFCLRLQYRRGLKTEYDYRELFTFLPQNNIALKLEKRLFYLSTFFIPLSCCMQYAPYGHKPHRLGFFLSTKT